MTPAPANDAWLYDAETVRVGCLIHGKRVCAVCACTLPESTDYFTPSEGRLRNTCKRCTRERHRESNKAHAQRRRDAARVTS